MRAPLSVLALVLCAGPLSAQTLTLTPAPPRAREISLAGPRFGFTAISDGVLQQLHTRNINVNPLITQFGWQLEKQFYGRDAGFTALNEWVVLMGGLEQGVAIPSVSWLVGLRSATGAEFGVGPNVTPAGVGLAFAAGMTMRTGILNVPLNVAVVPSRAGSRISVLTGFTLGR